MSDELSFITGSVLSGAWRNADATLVINVHDVDFRRNIDDILGDINIGKFAGYSALFLEQIDNFKLREENEARSKHNRV